MKEQNVVSKNQKMKSVLQKAEAEEQA